MFQTWHPHVLVSDMGLPDEDGNVLLHKVRALEAEPGPHVAALALTGNPRLENRQQALREGYQGYLPKPVTLTELTTAVAAITGR